MANFIKIILFLAVVLGLGLFLLGRYPGLSNLLKNSGRTSFSFFGPFSSTSSLINAGKTYSGAPISYYFPQWNPTFPVGGPSFPSTAGNYSLPVGVSQEQTSPYFQKVKIFGVSAFFAFGGRSQFQLYSNMPAGESVNITGWRVKSNRGDIIVIPKAVNFYDYTGFGPETDIIVSGNNVINIYGNASPMAKNLRLNKCTGYLNRVYNFTPKLLENCPALYNREDIIGLSGVCQSYILSLGGCQLPDAAFYNSLPGTEAGNACRNFLNTISVKSCYDKHRNDSDFLSNTWYVWIDKDPQFDSQHDLLKLYDREGLLVDQYIY